MLFPCDFGLVGSHGDPNDHTQARTNFVALCDEVTANGEAVIIHRRGAQDVALISGAALTTIY
jgi:PHD/YefM family antitoxin component YafN of YafNO toxin-antitoxin module